MWALATMVGAEKWLAWRMRAQRRWQGSIRPRGKATPLVLLVDALRRFGFGDEWDEAANKGGERVRPIPRG